jgi:hypothetical protein
MLARVRDSCDPEALRGVWEASKTRAGSVALVEHDGAFEVLECLWRGRGSIASRATAAAALGNMALFDESARRSLLSGGALGAVLELVRDGSKYHAAVRGVAMGLVANVVLSEEGAADVAKDAQLSRALLTTILDPHSGPVALDNTLAALRRMWLWGGEARGALERSGTLSVLHSRLALPNVAETLTSMALSPGTVQRAWEHVGWERVVSGAVRSRAGGVYVLAQLGRMTGADAAEQERRFVLYDGGVEAMHGLAQRESHVRVEAVAALVELAQSGHEECRAVRWVDGALENIVEAGVEHEELRGAVDDLIVSMLERGGEDRLAVSILPTVGKLLESSTHPRARDASRLVA